jgi:hypothetical protein
MKFVDLYDAMNVIKKDAVISSAWPRMTWGFNVLGWFG